MKHKNKVKKEENIIKHIKDNRMKIQVTKKGRQMG